MKKNEDAWFIRKTNEFIRSFEEQHGITRETRIHRKQDCFSIDYSSYEIITVESSNEKGIRTTDTLGFIAYIEQDLGCLSLIDDIEAENTQAAKDLIKATAVMSVFSNEISSILELPCLWRSLFFHLDQFPIKGEFPENVDFNDRIDVVSGVLCYLFSEQVQKTMNEDINTDEMLRRARTITKELVSLPMPIPTSNETWNRHVFLGLSTGIWLRQDSFCFFYFKEENLKIRKSFFSFAMNAHDDDVFHVNEADRTWQLFSLDEELEKLFMDLSDDQPSNSFMKNAEGLSKTNLRNKMIPNVNPFFYSDNVSSLSKRKADALKRALSLNSDAFLGHLKTEKIILRKEELLSKIKTWCDIEAEDNESISSYVGLLEKSSLGLFNPETSKSAASSLFSFKLKLANEYLSENPDNVEEALMFLDHSLSSLGLGTSNLVFAASGLFNLMILAFLEQSIGGSRTVDIILEQIFFHERNKESSRLGDEEWLDLVELADEEPAILYEWAYCILRS